ncbi:hypothetical protein BDQ17DRAFT_1372603 [Cyathus striatus]|nr:hypothetical protein BDQ17DRAFT_1372603 [Cyathus striatus]
MVPTRAPYNGPYRKLVLAFDVGTTYSGVSYSVLDPGMVPEIRSVTRFPAQEHVGGDSKIPTIMYYDKNGTMRAAGAEAMLEGTEESAEDEGWMKVEWFKLHLKPKKMSAGDGIPPLPTTLDKTIVEMFADFMKYLYKCAGDYIKETHANGRILWSSVENRIHFVLSHPNGWEGPQQSQMRQAAVLAGLVADMTAAQDDISFVTEGEASLHFCIQNGLTTEALNERKGVLIVDAGGGTIDISAYAISGSSDTEFEEVAAPQCHLHGSVFVTKRAGSFLADHLRGSKFAEDVTLIAEKFDKTTKLYFKDDSDPQYIKFGFARDKDLSVGIRSGQLKLSGSDVASFFEPSIKCILNAIKEQIRLASIPIKSVFLVGGFAASGWLYSQLNKVLEAQDMTLSRPDTHISKAVADGAVSFYVDHCVSIRVSKFFYGTECESTYSSYEAGHESRFPVSYVCPIDGERHIPGFFDTILPKGSHLRTNIAVSETKEFIKNYYRRSLTREGLMKMSEKLQCYRGELINPRWLDEDPDGYSTCCSITASVPDHIIETKYKEYRAYYTVSYSIILHFGRTELKAQISWNQNRIYCIHDSRYFRGPASVIYKQGAEPRS